MFVGFLVFFVALIVVVWAFLCSYVFNYDMWLVIKKIQIYYGAVGIMRLEGQKSLLVKKERV